MAITVANLKFYTAERMTDNEDGGGQMAGNEIISGQSNQIFDDLSDVDRAVGDASIRKVYAAVTSADTDKYLDAGVVIFKEPSDPDVSVLAFSTGDYYDERAALKNRIEQTISRGARWNGWLWGQHLTGQRVVVLWQRPENELPSTGQRLELVAKAGTVEQYSQFLWITRITESLRTRYDEQGAYQIREVVCELAEPLNANFIGPEPSRTDPSVSSAQSLVYDTRYNAEAVPLFGIRPVVEEATTGDFTVKVDTLYSPMIPTAFSETALPDVTPGGDSPALIAGNSGTVNFTTTTQCIKPDVTLYCGTGIYPGTLSISVSGSTITDDNGVARLSGTDIGAIDYGNGLIRWHSTCPNYSTNSKTVTFKPASKPLQVADTAAQVVTAENRGFVWVMTLTPIPVPTSLRISYRVNNVWYVISDQGGGLISGVDSSYGSGSLNFSTGTVTITTGALPDVDSEIIYAWNTPAVYTARGGEALDAPVVHGQTTHGGIAPNSVTVTWSTFTLTDDGHGLLTGTGGAGEVRYATGEWWVRPTTLPAGGTEFTIEYDWGTPIEETFAHPLRAGDGTLELTLANPNIKPGTVQVEWNLLVLDYAAAVGVTTQFVPDPAQSAIGLRSFDPIKIIRDDGAGVLPISGGTNGAINYSAGTLDFLPDVTVSIPKPLFENVVLGTSSVNSGGLTTIKTTWRTMFKGWEYIPAGAQYPSDETGYVIVRYRVTGGDTTATETLTLTTLTLDLTPGYAEIISAGSVRFLLAGTLYVETAGQIYRAPGPDTGAGTLSGSLDPSSGRVILSSWVTGSNTVTLQSMVTSLDVRPLDEVVFRTPTSPLKSGTLQLRWTTYDGTAKSKTVDGTGLLEDTDCTIQVDYPLGIVRARFGQWKTDASLSPEEKMEVWYDPDARIDFAGTLKIWKPRPVLASSLVYNAVAQTFLPPDSTLLGLNAARLPPDGKALIYVVGRLVLVHHTDTFAESSLSPTQVLDCGRVRLYRVAITDTTGAALPASFYSVNRELGTVTMASDLNLTGYTGPYTVHHTVGDLARLVETNINGALVLNRAVSHTYPADDSRVSGVLFIGTMQARYTNLFAQATWTSVWSDTLIGSEPLAQYNDTAFPVVVSNLGAYQDRILVKFTSGTAFQVFGENLGLIATGVISEDCAPVNPLTGQPYFTIDYRGWGAGWATGNCLRFNVIGANYPVDLIRAVQPSTPTGLDDSVELLLIGNTDSP